VLLLGLLASIAFGGLYLAVGDLLRFTRADAYLLVMTPDDFLLVTPRKTIHVPMTSVAYVTLKGIRVHTPPAQTVTPTLGGLGWLFGAGGASRSTSRRGAPSLAFLDLRTQREVVVATDNTFDDLPVLEEILSLHAKGQVAAESGSRIDR
jgi:hypothetical protein